MTPELVIKKLIWRVRGMVKHNNLQTTYRTFQKPSSLAKGKKRIQTRNEKYVIFLSARVCVCICVIVFKL